MQVVLQLNTKGHRTRDGSYWCQLWVQGSCVCVLGGGDQGLKAQRQKQKTFWQADISSDPHWSGPPSILGMLHEQDTVPLEQGTRLLLLWWEEKYTGSCVWEEPSQCSWEARYRWSEDWENRTS